MPGPKARAVAWLPVNEIDVAALDPRRVRRHQAGPRENDRALTPAPGPSAGAVGGEGRRKSAPSRTDRDRAPVAPPPPPTPSGAAPLLSGPAADGGPPPACGGRRRRRTGRPAGSSRPTGSSAPGGCRLG